MPPHSTSCPPLEPISAKEQLLEQYLDAMPGIAFVKNVDRTYTYVNERFRNVHDVSSNDIESHSLSDATLFPSEVVAELNLEDQRVIEEGISLQSTMDDGEGFAIKFPVKDREGTIIGIGGFIQQRETTQSTISNASYQQVEESSSVEQERNRTNEVLSDDEDLSRMEPSTQESNSGDAKVQTFNDLPIKYDLRDDEGLFSNMPSGAAMNEIVVDDAGDPIDFIFRRINPAFEALTGLKRNDILNRRATVAMPGIENDPSGWIQMFGKVAVEGTPHHFHRLYSDNLDRWYDGMVYKPSGDDLRIICLFLDVTDSVHREEELRESEERHRNLFESMIQGVVYQEANGSIIAANSSAERILGLTEDQMKGRTSVDPRWKSIREDGSDFPGDQHPSMEALRTGKKVTGVVMGVFHPTYNEHRWIVIDAVPRFRPGEEKPYQVYTTFTDTTETKNFERRLLREKERAECADRLKSAFLANMSHEIRTPLNGIIGHIDLALANNLGKENLTENLEGLHVARQSGELLISIIQDILDLSKIEAGQMTIQNDEIFNLRRLSDHVADLSRTMIFQKDKNIQFEMTLDSGIHEYICGDPFRLQQVLYNLLSNAVKFTDNGRVHLSISLPEENMLQFCVCDTGKGIPEDQRQSIFEPFRQVEYGDTRKHGGTGLGLTISKKLVEMMGGQMTLQSSTEGPTKGSAFCISYPYKPTQQVGGESQAETSRHNASTPSWPRSGSITEGRILVAEDETVSRRLVKRMLTIVGFDVILAEDGMQAVEAFQEHSDIALILMDVQMPNMDGLEATRAIRKLEATKPDKPEIPIIALSAGAMKGDNERGLAVGMTDYLTKPVNFKLLKQTLQLHVGLPHPEASASIPH